MSYRVNLRKLIKDSCLKSCFDMGLSDTETADFLTKEYGMQIGRQNVRYWRRIMEGEKKKDIVQERTLRQPDQSDWQADATVDKSCHDTILVIPDLHIPYHHPDAFEFLAQLYQAHPDATVVCLGDEVDNHALSFHDSDPNLDSAGTELAKARTAIAELNSIFPSMLICHSNHGSLQYRRAKAHGIPVEYLRTYREVMFPNGGGHGWEWAYSHTLGTSNGDILFKHQCTGDPRTAAAHEGTNLVVGHHHGRFDLAYGASSSRLYWGATAGCLLDRGSLAFAYGRETAFKPILGALLIIGGVPYHMPMILDEDGNWIGFQ